MRRPGRTPSGQSSTPSDVVDPAPVAGSARSQNPRSGVQPVATGMLRQRELVEQLGVQAEQERVNEVGLVSSAMTASCGHGGDPRQQPLRERPVHVAPDRPVQADAGLGRRQRLRSGRARDVSEHPAAEPQPPGWSGRTPRDTAGQRADVDAGRARVRGRFDRPIRRWSPAARRCSAPAGRSGRRG